MEQEDRIAAHHVGPGEGRAARSPWAELVTRKVAAARTGGAYSLFEVAVRPGGGPPPHVQHWEDECLYVLEGRFEFVGEEDDLLLLEEGAVIYVPKGTLHAFRNVGEGLGRLLAIHTPGGPHDSFIEEAASARGPADVADVIAAKHGIEVCRAEGREGRG